jgi:hypothetical protein
MREKSIIPKWRKRERDKERGRERGEAGKEMREKSLMDGERKQRKKRVSEKERC